jgi:hypothetical protein
MTTRMKERRRLEQKIAQNSSSTRTRKRLVGRKWVGEFEDAFLESDHKESVRTVHPLTIYSIQFPTAQLK